MSPARSFANTVQIIRTSRSLLHGRGNITAVGALLREYRLSALHTSIWNAFFMLPHADFDCFPQDFLHGMYVKRFYCPPLFFCSLFRLLPSSFYFFFARLLSATLMPTHCSDLGVILLVVQAIGAWIKASNPIKVMGQRRLQQLSLRVQRLTALLPNCIRVYGLFLDKGPSLQGGHYRYGGSCFIPLHFCSLRVCRGRWFSCERMDLFSHLSLLLCAARQSVCWTLPSRAKMRPS